MAANPLVGLPPHVCERVLERMDASDFAALACVSKASATMVRTSGALASRGRLVMRFMREPGANNRTALSEVMRCILGEEGVAEALAAPRLVCKGFYCAAHPHLRIVFAGVEGARALGAMSGLRAGQPCVPHRRPRVSFCPPSSSYEDEDEE